MDGSFLPSKKKVEEDRSMPCEFERRVLDEIKCLRRVPNRMVSPSYCRERCGHYISKRQFRVDAQEFM